MDILGIIIVVVVLGVYLVINDLQKTSGAKKGAILVSRSMTMNTILLFGMGFTGLGCLGFSMDADLSVLGAVMLLIGIPAVLLGIFEYSYFTDEYYVSSTLVSKDELPLKKAKKVNIIFKKDRARPYMIYEIIFKNGRTASLNGRIGPYNAEQLIQLDGRLSSYVRYNKRISISNAEQNALNQPLIDMLKSRGYSI